MDSWLQRGAEAELVGVSRSAGLPAFCGIVDHSPFAAGLGDNEPTHQPLWRSLQLYA